MKIGIVTMTTGFNYGTSLQAYASKLNLEKMGYEVDILAYKGSFIKGRDIRLKKLFMMFFNTISSPKLLNKTFKTYQKKLTKEIPSEAKELFNDFTTTNLQVRRMNYREMKRYAHSEETYALICGSDQIWSLASVYVDPFYYLRFAPRNKRISYAPSFGNLEIKDYNKKTIAKYLNGFDKISVREKEGQQIVKILTGKNSEVNIDPTLLINKDEWKSKINDKKIVEDEYALIYFLDSPTDLAVKNIILKIKEMGIKKIISIPYNNQKLKEISNDIEVCSAGPLEFLNLIYNAKIVLTDSYHGMLFSINFNKEFYIYERDYGTAANQSSRIESILEILKLEKRFIKKEYQDLQEKILWEETNKILEEQRKKSRDYLDRSLQKVVGNSAK